LEEGKSRKSKDIKPVENTIVKRKETKAISTPGLEKLYLAKWKDLERSGHGINQVFFPTCYLEIECTNYFFKNNTS